MFHPIVMYSSARIHLKTNKAIIGEYRIKLILILGSPLISYTEFCYRQVSKVSIPYPMDACNWYRCHIISLTSMKYADQGPLENTPINSKLKSDCKNRDGAIMSAWYTFWKSCKTPASRCLLNSNFLGDRVLLTNITCLVQHLQRFVEKPRPTD
jgi:hypothetical protein